MDHPHACGDKSSFAYIFPHSIGSSPRVWGQESICVIFYIKNRIIPTRVGTSRIFLHKISRCADHPHACGDKEICPASRRFELGSSPRVWGQATAVTALTTRERIIPTRVGTSYIALCQQCAFWDHPHACGDK